MCSAMRTTSPLHRIYKWDQLWIDLAVNVVGSSVVTPAKLRHLVYDRMGIRIGAGSLVAPRCYFWGTNVSLGRDCYVNQDCYFDALEHITIEDRVSVGMQVLFTTATHELSSGEQRASPQPVGRPIVVRSGAWVGARAIVLGGVTIGEGCVIAAGAVVTDDCEPNRLYAGVPARAVRPL